MDSVIENDLRTARAAAETIARRRAELRRECENAVVRWRWASEGSDLQRPEPLYRQRFAVLAPRLLDEPPVVPQDEQQYGYDADGHIVVAREYVGPESFREELRVRRARTVEGYRWSETGELSEVNVARFADGLIRSYVALWPESRSDSLHGWSIERYEHDGELVAAIHGEIVDAIGDEPLQRSSTLIRASYDALGRLLELREHGDEGEKVLYRAPGTGPSMDELQRRVEDRLVETLPKLVAEYASDEALYCLVLHYHLEWPLPPTVAVGREGERETWMSTIDDPEMLRFTVWNPAEFSNYRDETLHWNPADVDPELERAIRAIPENDDGGAERARATLNRAARRLQQLDWRSIAPVTDDFVVFAVDYELTHLEENLRHSVPATLRKALSSRSLV